MNNQYVRLQKYLAERGIGSRRCCETYIAEGRVKVNDKITVKPGSRIDPYRDKVMFDGKIVPSVSSSRRTIMLYKPRGYICSASSKQGRTVYELLDEISERLVPVGRLDKDSEGLLLMSNDGGLINRLTHPRFQQEKTYHATVSGNLDDLILKTLQSRLIIDGYRIQPAKVMLLSKSEEKGRYILEFILKEGRNRQIRKMCEQAGLKVLRLLRVKIKNLALSGLKAGKWRDLTRRELADLLQN